MIFIFIIYFHQDVEIESYQNSETDHSKSKYEVYDGEVVDLRGDTYVNQLMADQGAPINPYAETFDTESVEFLVEHREQSPKLEHSMSESEWDTMK